MYIAKDLNGFICEEYPYQVNCGFTITDDVTKATKYSSYLEFLCATEYVDNKTGYKIDLGQTELIDITTLFPLNIDLIEQRKKAFTKRNLKVTEKDFKLLQKCWYGSSHWLLDAEGKWITSPKDDKNVKAIKYFKRGLICTIADIFHYRNASIPGCYSFHAARIQLLKNKDILQIALDDSINSCEYFLVTT